MKKKIDINTLSDTLFYYQLYKPEIELFFEINSSDMGIIQRNQFKSAIHPEIPKQIIESANYQKIPKIKSVIFLDALFIASKGLEPFLTISTRLYKLLVDDLQDKAAELDLDEALFTKIKTIYWSVLQEEATEDLMEHGFEIVTQEAMLICTRKIIEGFIAQL